MTTNTATGAVVDHRIGTSGKLVINLAVAELRLTATDDDRVVVRTPGGRPLPGRVVIETTGNGLSIRDKSGISVSFGRDDHTIELDIDVPRLAAVSIDTATGTLVAEGLRGSQHYRTASGEIELRAAGGRIDLAGVSGDVRITLAEAASVAIKSVSGDVAMDGGQLDALRVQTTSGDVRIDSPLVGRSGNAIETLSGDVDLVVGGGIRVEARTISGDLTSDLPHRSEGRMGRRTLIVDDGAIELSFRSVSGDLRIRGAASLGSPNLPARPANLPDRFDAPEPPQPPQPLAPAAPLAPVAPVAPDRTIAAENGVDGERMTILRALEQGEMDVATALDLLAALDAGSPADDSAPSGGDANAR